MRIGLLLTSNSALHEPGDGRVMQAKCQADALESLGHDVVRMESWNPVPRESLDVLHVFEGGFGNFVLVPARPRGFKRIAFAPFIDSNVPFWRYRIAASAHIGQRLYSAQYVQRVQGLNANVMIARSTHERERFVHGLGIPASKIAIVLNGMTAPPPTEIQEVRARLGLPDKFILHVGFYTQDRKNVLRLAAAAAALQYPLVLAGTPEPGPNLQRLQLLEKQLGPQKLRRLEFVDRPTLHALYHACEVFALPSTHEGTGLVALEAASFGAKVVITKNGGPPDYFQKLADYVDPFSIDDITRALRAAWERPRTDTLRRHVLENLTWRKSAEQLVAAYEGKLAP